MLVVKEGVEIYLHYLIAGDEDDNEKYQLICIQWWEKFPSSSVMMIGKLYF